MKLSIWEWEHYHPTISKDSRTFFKLDSSWLKIGFSLWIPSQETIERCKKHFEVDENQHDKIYKFFFIIPNIIWLCKWWDRGTPQRKPYPFQLKIFSKWIFQIKEKKL